MIMIMIIGVIREVVVEELYRCLCVDGGGGGGAGHELLGRSPP